MKRNLQIRRYCIVEKLSDYRKCVQAVASDLELHTKLAEMSEEIWRHQF